MFHAYYKMMEHNRGKNQTLEGGTMKLFLMILLLLGVSVAQVLPEKIEYIGLMPTVEVIAQRYEEDIPGYIGAMPEVTVTAPRYEYEDEAWSGLMPEVEVTAIRPSADILAYSDEKRSDTDGTLTAPAH
jgi:hypothetical protein